MLQHGNKGIHVGRRDFIKTTTMASVVATLPGSALLGQDTGGLLKPGAGGMKRRLLFLSDAPATFERLTNSIQSIKEVEFLLNPVTVNYQKPQEILTGIKGKEADVILMCRASHWCFLHRIPT
jgi:hypothetical protein